MLLLFNLYFDIFSLPLDLLLFKTLRPAFVCILFVKPCFFLAFLVFGWYVLFGI